LELKPIFNSLDATGIAISVAGTCAAAKTLVADMADGSAQILSVENGSFRLTLPTIRPYGSVIQLTVKGPTGTQRWTAQDFVGARWRWLFAPIPLQVIDVERDVRNYSTRIANRRILFDYAEAIAKHILAHPEHDAIAVAQVAAVLCYRLCDAPALATYERLDLVWRMLDAFRHAEPKVGNVHWSISIRYACAQLALRYGLREICLECLTEIQPLEPLSREKPASIYNYVKACLLLGSLRTLEEDWLRARSAFRNAIEIAYFAPVNATRSFSSARELSDVLLSCAYCLAGRDLAVARLAGRSAPSKYFDPRVSIRSTLRFKNGAFLDETVESAFRIFPPREALAKVIPLT
jgi:hypothetical protein